MSNKQAPSSSKPIPEANENSVTLDIGQGINLVLPLRENLVGGLQITQRFSNPEIHPYDQVEWELRDIAIFDFKKGKNAYERNGVEVPKFWDTNAAQTTVSKYLFGNSPDTPEYENSLKNAFDRIANTYTVWGWKHGYFLDLESAKAFNWELKYMLVNQIWAPNSPVWFNVGHWEQWRWGRPDLREKLGGNVAYKAFVDENNELIVKELKNSFEHGQMSACQPGWALINTELGLLPIKEIHEKNLKGLRVMDSKGTTSILATKMNGKKPVYKIHFQDGRFIEATGDHVVATFLGRTQKIKWVTVNELAIGDTMRLHNQCDLLEKKRTARAAECAEAFLAGWNQADGCTAQYASGNKSIIMEWVALDDEEENALREAISLVFPQTKNQKEKVEGQKRNCRGGIHEDNTPHILEDGRRLRRIRLSGEYLKEFAEKYELFNRKLDIRVPNKLWKAPLNAVYAYLRGAFQGDGFVSSQNSSHYVNITTISQKWMDDIQILLTRCGIYSRIQNYEEPRNDRQDTRTVCIANKSERIKFAERIGFVNEAKREKLRKTLSAKGKKCRVTKHLEIVKIEAIGTHEVFDIQTESEEYLTNGILVHNCFLTGVEDSMESILQHQVAEGRIFSSGSGVGINISTLRSSKEPIAGKGRSSGPISFDKGWDKMAGAIKSGGKTRRAARMILMDSNHPDIMTFVNLKNEQEHLAKVILREHNSHVELKALAEKKLQDPKSSSSEKLAAQFVLSLPLVTEESYSGAMDGIIYGETISNQNANHSVSLLGDFWDAYYSKGNYSTRWVTKPDKIDETFSAAELLMAMAKSVYDNAEPGCHNNDWINLWSPYKSIERLTTSNPCITGDSLVAGKGLTEIEKLAGKFPSVIGADGLLHNAKAVFPTGVKELLLLETVSGFQLKLTPDHKVLTKNRGDVHAKDLTPEDSVILKGAEFTTEEPNPVATYLAGQAAASMGGGTRLEEDLPLVLRFSGSERDQAENTLEILRDHQVELTSTPKGWDVTALPLWICKNARELVDANGALSPYALSLGKNATASLIRGFMDRAGKVTKSDDGEKSLTAMAESAKLLEQIQILLLGYGIKAQLDRAAAIPRISISGQDLGKYNSEIGSRIHKGLKTEKNQKSDLEWMGFQVDLIDQIKSLTPLAPAAVYDLTEPRTSHFVANGMVIHNCSEYLAPINTSCNLSSFNAYRFLDKDTKEIKTGLLEHGVLLAMIVADLNVEEGGFPIPEIARETYNYRTTGIGYGNIGGLLMSLGIPYDSDEGRWMAGAMMSLLTAACWKASYQMGREYGAYRKYAETKNDLTKVIDLHIAADALLAKLPGLDHDKVEDIISKGPNSTLPSWGSLQGRSALRALASSFNLDTPWDETMVSPARKVVQASAVIWREVKKEMKAGQPRNSFVSLVAPGGCLVENSLVLTGSGLKRLRRMGNPGGAQWQEIEEKVQTDDGPQEATKFYINGKAETRIIQTERLLEVQGTGSHRIKRLNPDTLELEWARLKDIKKGDVLASKLGGMFGPTKPVWLPKLPMLHHNNTSGTTAPEVMTEELAEFVGLFCGAGSLHQRSVRIACTMEDKDLTAYILDLGKKLFNLKGKVNPKKEGQQSVSVDFYSHPIATWMAACGFQKHGNREGKKSKKPYIPDAILETNDPKIYGAFLRGLAEADGTVGYKGNPTISTHYAPFAQEIMVLMLALGIAPSMDDCTISGHSGKILYRVSLLNHDYLPIWKKYVGFLSNRKSGKQEHIPQRSFSRNDTIPVSTEWLRKAKQQVRNKGGLSAGLRKGVLTKNAARQIIKLEQNSELGKKLKALLGYVFTPVLDNKDGGVQHTYDLSVPSNVTYMANGFISHNTISAPLGIYDQGTTAIEPDYTLVKYKVLAGGGMLRMFNRLALEGLRSVGYSEWHIQEAAFEVAGLNGLYVACLGNVDAVVKHLIQPTNEASGPVREVYKNLDTSSPAYQEPHTMVHQLAIGNTQGLPELLVNGKGHVEKIPWLSDHHRAIFDCAATTSDGVRSIHPEGHIKMLGAIQPFISGASSKTVNLPHYATVEEILHCFELSHKLGVKCIALYRDGSKGVSVYQTNSPESQKWIVDNIWKSAVDAVEAQTNEIVAQASVPKRKKLDGRRWSQVVKFGIAGQGNLEGFLIVGMYPDGTCGEVFGKLGQGGSFAHGMFESFCKAFSVMLQWGVPFPQAIGTFKSMAFDPSGFTKVGDPDSEHSRADIKSCKSVVDLVMQILKWMFPEENEYKIRDLQSSEIHLTSTLVTDQRPAISQPALGAPYGEQKAAITKMENIDLSAAETCPDCGSLSVIQDGRCRKCTHCGYSSGGCGG